jgi:hypothetical protein
MAQRSKLLVVLAVWLAAVSSATAQLSKLDDALRPPAPTESTRDVLLRARGAYYTLSDRGLKTFRCVVAPDWKQVFTGIIKHELSPEELKKIEPYSDLYFVVTEEQGAREVKVKALHRSSGSEADANDQLVKGYLQMISGFFQMWLALTLDNPVELGADDSFTREADGYRVHSRSGSNSAEVFMDNQLIIRRMSMEGTTLRPTFERTEQGLMISDVDADLPNDEKGRFTIEYATVQGFRLPSRVKIHVSSAAMDLGIAIDFTQYQVN